MTETTMTALGVAAVVSIAPTIAAVASWRQGKANAVKSDALIVKADEIHTLTNSNLQVVREELQRANERIEALQTLVGALTGNKRAGDPGGPV